MKPIRGIGAVTFDVGGTLIEPAPSVGHVYAEVAARHGAGIFEAELLNRRFAAAWRASPQPIHSASQWAKLVDDTFANLVAEPPSRTFFNDLYARFSQPGAWRVFDDVNETLAGLTERNIRLGIISNWDERLRPLLTALGLAERFQVITVSCEEGVAKPSPEIFLGMAARMGLAPSAILHVGDSREDDALGARAAGFQAVQIARREPPDGEERISSLLDLLALVWPSNSK